MNCKFWQLRHNTHIVTPLNTKWASWSFLMTVATWWEPMFYWIRCELVAPDDSSDMVGADVGWLSHWIGCKQASHSWRQWQCDGLSHWIGNGRDERQAIEDCCQWRELWEHEWMQKTVGILGMRSHVQKLSKGGRPLDGSREPGECASGLCQRKKLAGSICRFWKYWKRHHVPRILGIEEGLSNSKEWINASLIQVRRCTRDGNGVGL